VSENPLSGGHDVLVIGAGNAAMSAALTAGRLGARVLVLESADKVLRGGNSRHVRNIRYAHKGATDYVTGPYEDEEYWQDLLRVTDGKTDEEMARFMIRASESAADWMIAQGVKFQPPLSGTIGLARTNAFFLGGGKAMMNDYFRTAQALGVDVVYEAEVETLEISGARFEAAIVKHGGATHRVPARTVVLASGGFESNIEWLKEGWGEAAENFLIRGTPHNTGKMLRAMLDAGAQSIGEVDQCHAIAIDSRSPKYDGGISTRVDSIIYSVMVNKNAKRFYDEGEDIWPKRYAIWGRLIAKEPDQIAYSIIDQKSIGLFMPPLYPGITSETIAGLAEKLVLDPAALEKTIAEFNAAVRPGEFKAQTLDGCRTDGLTPPKSNWARKIDTPPYVAYPVRTGITFTYLGVNVNKQAQVLMQDGKPAPNIWAAGEIMSGNILGQGYAAGTGMAIGTVFGRIAGEEAARHARN